MFIDDYINYINDKELKNQLNNILNIKIIELSKKNNIIKIHSIQSLINDCIDIDFIITRCNNYKNNKCNNEYKYNKWVYEIDYEIN